MAISRTSVGPRQVIRRNLAKIDSEILSQKTRQKSLIGHSSKIKYKEGATTSNSDS